MSVDDLTTILRRWTASTVFLKNNRKISLECIKKEPINNYLVHIFEEKNLEKKFVVYSRKDGQVFLRDDEKEHYEFICIGKVENQKMNLLNTEEEQDEKALYFEIETIMKREKLSPVDIRMYELFFSIDSANFIKWLKCKYGHLFSYNQKTKSWYECHSGVWKNFDSMENFGLQMRISGEVSKMYGIYEKAFSDFTKNINEKLKTKFSLKIDNGKINKQQIYVKGNIYTSYDDKKSNPVSLETLEPKKQKLITKYWKYEKKQLISEALKKKMKDVINYVPSVVRGSRPYFVNEDIDLKLDKNTYLLPFKNCYIDLRNVITSGQIVPLPHDPLNYISLTTGQDLLKFEYCEKEKEIIEENISKNFTTDDKYQNMLESRAYSLIGENPLKLFFIDWGESGNNGKGLVDVLMKKALGKLYGTMDSEVICQGKESYDPERPCSTLYNSMRCRYVQMTEPAPTAKLNAEVIKRLRGGDPLSVRQLRKEAEIMIPHFTQYLQSNFYLQFDGFDSALLKSIALILWEVEFLPKSELKEETSTKKWQTSIKSDINLEEGNKFGSAWMWILLSNLNLDYKIHPDFKAVNKEQVEEMNHLSRFIDESITFTKKLDTEKDFHYITKDPIFKLHRTYYINQGLKPMTRTIFFKELDKLIIEKFGEIIHNTGGGTTTLKGKTIRTYYQNLDFTKDLDDSDLRKINSEPDEIFEMIEQPTQPTQP